MNNPRSALLSQAVMTFLMAASMSGIMGLTATGPSAEWLARWPQQFIIAWPVATRVTAMIMRPRHDGAGDGGSQRA